MPKGTTVCEIAPVYEHDCNACKYLGHAQGFDLYYCGAEGQRGTVIARWASDPPSYYSGLGFGERGHYPLSIAYWLAVGAGMIADPNTGTRRE